jgi:ABC-type transport system involved in cytochrome bd biosynthesis fused ATPase/permease subunit
VSNLVGELLLRLVKPLVAAILAAIVYAVATGILGAPGSVSLALLCWLSAAAFVLLVDSGLF